MPAILHTDLPTLDDKLGLENQLVGICERITTCKTPHVIGIHGDWGSGKTSFMRQLQQMLGGDPPTDASVEIGGRTLSKTKKKELQKSLVTVWFDAWQFQNEPAPVVALLHEMRRQLSASVAVLESLKKIGTISTLSALDSLSSLGKSISLDFIPDIEKIEKRGQQWEKEHFKEPLASSSIRENLCNTIDRLLPSPEARIIIFIDDLDRCSPAAAIRLLEGLKIYLTVPNCVFILGMNERILVEAISEAFAKSQEKKEDELKLRAAHYLEKICTDVFRLALPRSPILLLSQWIPQTSFRQALQVGIGSCACIPPNPRRLKALANQWNRFATYNPFPAKHEAQKIWAVKVLIAAYFHQFHRDLWERWHFNPNFWGEILALCKGDFGANPPDWGKSLKLTFSPANYVTGQPNSVFPNPGDIDNFWIGNIVFEYKDHLKPLDFEGLIF